MTGSRHLRILGRVVARDGAEETAMDGATIYRKTPRGLEAIATRQPALEPRQRSLLILVDGKRGMQDLARFACLCGDVQALLAGWREQGFIEAVVEAAPRAERPQAPRPRWDFVQLLEQAGWFGRSPAGWR